MADRTAGAYGSRRGWLLVAAAVCALLLGGSALAWACTDDAVIQVNPQSGPVGTEVEVEGVDFAPDNLVELHWDSEVGPVIGTARGPAFTTTVVIPEAEPGQHTIVAVQVNVGPSGPGLAPQSFLVTAAPNPASNRGPGGGGSAESGDSGSSSNRGGSDAVSSGERAPAVQREIMDSGGSVFSGSAPVSGPPSGTERVGRSVSERTAISDPATGYSTGTAPSLGSAGVAIGGDPSTPFAFGLALLGTGLLVLLAGGLFVVLAKRKAPAEKGPRSAS